jgi:hypothetical protein
MAEDDATRRDGEPSGEQLEEQWERALDAESDALEASARAKTLGPSELQEQEKNVREQRAWLKDFSGSLRKLLPGRGARREESS